jgi:branched-chain amino acid transport system substrate-binding protein
MKILIPHRIVLALAFLACLVGQAQSQNIRIGFQAPLTGPAASDGKTALQGAQLAVEQINSSGGVRGRQIELVVLDDQTQPAQAVPIANKFIGDGIKAVISGSYSGPTRAAAGVFQEAKIPYISAYAIHPDIVRAGNYVFRTSFMGEVQGRAAAKLIVDIMKKKRVTMINVNNDFGQALSAGMKDAAPKLGLQLISEYNFGMGDRQFGSIVASVKKDDPEVIYVSGYFFNGGPLVAQLRAGGVTAPIVGTEGFDTANFVQIAKEAAEGVIITTSLDRDTTDPTMRKFIDDYKKRFNVGAEMVAASTHTAVNVLVEAIRKVGIEDSTKLRNEIGATKNMPSAAGTITFNSSREVYKAAQIQIIKNGEFKRFAVIDDPVLLAPPTY